MTKFNPFEWYYDTIHLEKGKLFEKSGRKAIGLRSK